MQVRVHVGGGGTFTRAGPKAAMPSAGGREQALDATQTPKTEAAPPPASPEVVKARPADVTKEVLHIIAAQSPPGENADEIHLVAPPSPPPSPKAGPHGVAASAPPPPAPTAHVSDDQPEAVGDDVTAASDDFDFDFDLDKLRQQRAEERQALAESKSRVEAAAKFEREKLDALFAADDVARGGAKQVDEDDPSLDFLRGVLSAAAGEGEAALLGRRLKALEEEDAAAAAAAATATKRREEEERRAAEALREAEEARRSEEEAKRREAEEKERAELEAFSRAVEERRAEAPRAGGGGVVAMRLFDDAPTPSTKFFLEEPPVEKAKQPAPAVSPTREEVVKQPPPLDRDGLVAEIDAAFGAPPPSIRSAPKASERLFKAGERGGGSLFDAGELSQAPLRPKGAGGGRVAVAAAVEEDPLADEGEDLNTAPYAHRDSADDLPPVLSLEELVGPELVNVGGGGGGGM
jgi:hypothetical protein